MSAAPRSDAWRGVGTGWAVVSTLVAGLLTVGGLGFVADLAFDTGRVLTGIGFVVGGVCGTYIVYLRFGKGDRAIG